MADIKPWLDALKFEKQSSGEYRLTINGSIITVDIEKKKIEYPPQIKVGRNTTTNFSAEENFVVLEAVVGLLKQGYKPQQISIEKAYQLGHNKKSGNADITVENYGGAPFLIVEVKTWGREFDKEWNNTLRDGGQLFSYEKQENKAQALVLYASHVIDDSIYRAYNAIILNDNQKFLDTLDTPRGYQDARGGNDKFEIWRDTYQQDYVTNGVLETTIEPFTIGKEKMLLANLKEITHDGVQKKYNQFASILRKYNISGRENAFDVLVNLFLAKIVDEQQNSNDLQFNWKGVAQDTYFDLVDRLEKLYQSGMRKFLDEEVSYVAETDIEDAFRLKEDAAKDVILGYFKVLKYFSNNDYSFLDVYNENLFYKNSKILVEVVQMLQSMKLRTQEHNQFLGDLFEDFLDNGVKQSEGQFFTPLPIVKFIVSSLPLNYINEQSNIPKVIDYACGSGHFLNEYAEQIKRFVDEDNLAEHYSEIVGIEKEYRLSKVAKVSAFMYSQDEINIIYGDALTPQDGVKDNSYSVLVANPPYSVKGFLETLSDTERKRYALNKYVNRIDTNNSIELFFIERAQQLLKPEGVAGIIVPTPFLSNDDKLYQKARKMILKDFNIISIAELGGGAFGSTGTETSVLFLRKKKYPPNEFDSYKYAVGRWFNNSNVLDSDIVIIQSYCDKLGYDYEDYCEIQDGNLGRLLDVDLFKEYILKFNSTPVARRIDKRKITKTFTQIDKDTELLRAQSTFVRNIEREKVTYFALVQSQKNDVVVVKPPQKTSGMAKGEYNELLKKYRGYGWSRRQRQGGIKYMGADISDNEMEVFKNQAINNIQTPLFNPLDLDDATKINSVIRSNFNTGTVAIPQQLQELVSSMSLVDMLDFTQTDFDAQLKTIPQKRIEIVSKYPVKKLGEVVDVRIGGTPPRKNSSYYINGNNLWVSISEMNGQTIMSTKEMITDEAVQNSNVKLIPQGTTLLSFKLTIGKTAIAGKDLYTNEAIAGLIPLSTNLLDKYIFAFFNSHLLDLENVSSKAFGKSLNSKYLKNEILIPIPPKDIQEKIIVDVEKLDKRYAKSRMEIEEYREQITDIFRELEVLGGSL